MKVKFTAEAKSLDDLCKQLKYMSTEFLPINLDTQCTSIKGHNNLGTFEIAQEVEGE